MKITAKDLTNLLIKRHSDWICVPECKTGSHWKDKNVPRLDLWAMAKSWTKPRSVGFEIKVSRSDFLNDNKWRKYLEYCSEFYFVAPPGIIEPDELPAEAGLMVCSKNAKMLYIKKKAPQREVQIPEDLYKYIMMWRCVITNEPKYQGDRTQRWKEWLKKKDENKELGYNVSYKIRKILNQKVKKVDNENKQLIRQNEKLQDIKDYLEKIGINLNSYSVMNRLKDKIAEIEQGVPCGLVNSIDIAIRNLESANEILKKETRGKI